MADNYLENQYEQYQARKAAWEREQKYGKKKPQSTIMQSTTLQNITSQSRQRRVFVTGGAEGIGRAIVGAFGNDGCLVAFCDKNEEAGRRTAQETGALFFPVDVSDGNALETCMQTLFAQWGDIDVIINNAGISRFAPLTETSLEEFDKIVSVNLRPVFITSHALAVHRKSKEAECECKAETDATPKAACKYGRIINICSTRYLMSEPGSEGYAASKGGIYSLTHALAISLSEQHITVNSISPGWIQNSNYHQLQPEDHAQHPSGRVGRPEDIARMCLFLCHEENDFINGENITIDGGMTKKMIYFGE